MPMKKPLYFVFTPLIILLGACANAPPLIVAASEGDIAQIRSLIASVADANERFKGMRPRFKSVGTP